MPLGENIKQARIMAKMSQEELAQKLGYKSRSTIAKIESGENDLTQKKVTAFAKALNVSIDFLMDGVKAPHVNIPVYKIPVLGKVVAGTPIDAIENITDYIRVTNPAAADGSYYALHVVGASMEPEMREGDLVIVHKQEYFDNGDICIVLVNGNEATVKKVQKSAQGITLIGFNAVVYPPHFYNAKEVEDLPVKIIGKVEEVRRKY
jgi:repressor LexA|nr:S24 family peptidase [uncultured Dialister sp.]DAP87059.1 MAG TPA: Repressor protein CI [Caudoviricetes sp.]